MNDRIGTVVDFEYIKGEGIVSISLENVTEEGLQTLKDYFRPPEPIVWKFPPENISYSEFIEEIE